MAACGTRVFLLLSLLSFSLTAHAQTCEAQPSLSLTRHVRQLYLDLLGRPPTVAEYAAASDKGGVDSADIDALMEREEFYARMRGYHRALLRSNIASSVYNNGDSRLRGTGNNADPFWLAGNPSANWRGLSGARCDAYVRQSSCASATEDSHANLARGACYDSDGIPLAVSYDYDTRYFTCTALSAADCNAAITAGTVPAKHRYFCDMKRGSTGTLKPSYCLPRADLALTTEVTDTQGNVIAFTGGTTTGTLTRLDRCTLTQPLRNNVRGGYMAQVGCIHREGYEMTAPPFFDTSGRTQVAMCAIEAQQRDKNPGTMERCDRRGFLADRTCGCGPGARRCESVDGTVHQRRLDAFNAEPELIADSILRRNEPYFNVLTTQRSFLNGPLSNIYRHAHGIAVFATSPPAAIDALPELPFAQNQWVEYTRGAQHSGVLTTPAFLYRFPTARSRINAFYEAFLCRSFAPPAGASFPAPDDSCNRENNLAKRCGCNYCHATLEPLGAYWGRFAERGATHYGKSEFPRFESKCRDCALAGDVNCGGLCGPYVMRAFDGDGAASLGMLFSYLYRTPGEEQNIEEGPRMLANKMMGTGELEQCVVRRMWKEFLGHPMTEEEERLELSRLSETFAQSRYNLKKLIKEILNNPEYRRVD
jgi:hypothetical protein